MLAKHLALDEAGKFYTQSLFLEIQYSDNAVYTLKDYDHTHKGKHYPSLKKLYLELEDPIEFDFADTYLFGWRHWQRICENKVLRRYIDEWRDELEFKLRSRAFKQTAALAASGSYQASKWVADRGWAIKGPGRPSKADVEQRKALEARLDNEYSADVIRLHGTGS